MSVSKDTNVFEVFPTECIGIKHLKIGVLFLRLSRTVVMILLFRRIETN